MKSRKLGFLMLAMAAGCGSPLNVAGGDLAMTVLDMTMGPPDLIPPPCIYDSQCGGATPVCNRATGKCAGCLADANCPQGMRCNTQVYQCVSGCSAMRGCGDAGVCELDAGMCIAMCKADADCANAAAPRCDTNAHVCVPCLPLDDNCAAGSFCHEAGGAYACAEGCKADKECQTQMDGGFTGACCNHACTDTSKDPANCGVCGGACAQGGTCCGAICTDSTSDVMNCGGCGKVCPAEPNAHGICAKSKCGIATCNQPWVDCDNNIQNGCEVNTGDDINNCGMCGNVCQAPNNASAACVAGICGVGVCDKLFGDCNGIPQDGCEQSLASDPNNCGACANACNTPNATPSCTMGVCGVAKCAAGFADCDGKVPDGCEVSISSDPMNCGACGTVCPQNMARCVNGVCSAAAQYVGTYNCSDGPNWSGNPPTYTCQEACAKIFGGSANQYSCSTQMGSVDHMANESAWGINGCHIVAENYKLNTFYNCGQPNCAESAYVADNCFPGTNYCFK